MTEIDQTDWVSGPEYAKTLLPLVTKDVRSFLMRSFRDKNPGVMQLSEKGYRGGYFCPQSHIVAFADFLTNPENLGIAEGVSRQLAAMNSKRGENPDLLIDGIPVPFVRKNLEQIQIILDAIVADNERMQEEVAQTMTVSLREIEDLQRRIQMLESNLHATVKQMNAVGMKPRLRITSRRNAITFQQSAA